LFTLLANAWGRAHAVHAADLRVLAVDGVVWSAPHSQDNRQQLGSGQTQYGPQPWPMVRAVCLLDTDRAMSCSMPDWGTTVAAS
jgi:hypothetical protein